MTPYGDAPRLGDTIDPRLMAQDFSGFARAGAIKGHTLADLGQNIGDIIKIRGEQKKQEAAGEQFLKQGREFFKGTPFEGTFTNAYQEYTSEDITGREKRALVSSIMSLLPMGMQAQEMRIGQAGAASKRMDMTPEQYERAVASGAKMEDVVYQNGIYTANVSTPSSGILGPGAAFAQRPDGGFEIVRRDAQDGASRLPYFHDQAAATPSFGGVGMTRAIPASGIADAASGYETGPQLPPDVLQLPQGVGGTSDILLGGEIPPPQQQQFEDPSLLEVLANRGREIIGQPPRAYVVNEQAAVPQPAPQMPAGQPPVSPLTASQLRQASEAAEGDIPVVEGGRITGFTQAEGSGRQKDVELKGLKIEEQKLKLQQMEGDLTEKEKEAVKNSARELYKSNSGYIAIREINKSLDILEGMDSGSISAILRAGAGVFPATKSQTLKRSLATLQNKVAFDLLTNLKQSSPTGGAVGSLSDPEREAMGATQGSLKITDDVPVLKQNLKDLRRYYADYIHQNQQQRMDALKEGKITKAQYDAGEALWNDMAEGKSGDEVKETITPLISPEESNLINKYLDK